MKTIALMLLLTASFLGGAQVITFDDQGHVDQGAYGNPYTIVNNGETFIFTVSGVTGGPTTHRYRTTDVFGCGNTGANHLSSGNFSATTWTVETQSGNQINLGTIRFDNFFQCFTSFQYNLTIEGFKNNVSTGSQAFVVTGMNSIFTSNASFNDIDKFVITCSDLANLGIDNINWALVPCTPPTVPTITATSNPICPGSSSTLNIAGNLNDATAWNVYSGSCGGTLIGTTSGSSFTVSPGTTTTYFVRGQGGCVTPGACSAFTVNVSDNIAPVPNITNLPNLTAQCQVASLIAPIATDNCAGTITGSHNATLPITTQGTTVVTWTYNDGNGNTSTQTQNVVIDDIAAPVANVATLPNVSAQCQVATLTAPTATDNCAGTITGTHNATLPITAQGTTVVTWTYNDGNGNTSTQTQNVVIDDVTAPVANVATLTDVTSECSVTSLTAPTATDNCAGTFTGTHNATLPITSQGTTVVTWTYNDGNGNTSTQTQNVVIDDVTAPVANVASLPNVSAQCQVATLTVPTATDNCAGTITGTHNATLPITAQGTTVVTWTYNDGNGNTSTQTQNVVIDDVTAPVANVATLADVTSECSVTSLTAPTATDNCTGTITGTHNATLPITSQGTTVVTWTYNDGNGNTSTQTQNVVIDDVTAPVADVATLTDVTSECSVTSLAAPTATDNCAGTITGTHNATLPITSQGTTVVTWTYDDGNGNTSTQTQNVVIDDVTSPVVDLNSLADILALCEVNNLNVPTATDNCAGSVTATHNVTLPLTVQGTTVVTWTYDDGNGNISTQTQNVIISGPNVAVTQVDEITLTADLTGADYQWVDCNNGYQLLNGETNQTFVATANGSYAVIVDNGTCADTSNCFVISTVGLSDEWNTESIQVYPNPTKGKLNINLGNEYNEVKLEIVDNLGRIVANQLFKATNKIDLELDVVPGNYILRIQSDKSDVYMKKLVIE